MAVSPNDAPPRLFDPALLRLRQQRAVTLGPATFLFDRVAGELSERLDVVLRNFEIVADVGSPLDLSTVLSREKFRSIMHVDLPTSDDARLPLDANSLDLAVSSLALQFVNDLPGAFAQVRRALKPDGLFLAAMIGGDTLTELRQAFAAAEAEVEGGVSPRVAPFADLRDLGALLQRAGFALPVTDADRIIVRYDNAFALMRDLRRMGATNVLVERSRKSARRTTFLRMAEIYQERFSDPDGRIRATFEVVWMSGWAPHDSQQKPLKPGSAKASLAEAVGRLKKNDR